MSANHSDALNFTETLGRPQKSPFPALQQHKAQRRLVQKDGAGKPLPKVQPCNVQAELSIGDPRAGKKLCFKEISLKFTAKICFAKGE